jgi:hypothetical protein
MGPVTKTVEEKHRIVNTDKTLAEWYAPFAKVRHPSRLARENVRKANTGDVLLPKGSKKDRTLMYHIQLWNKSTSSMVAMPYLAFRFSTPPTCSPPRYRKSTFRSQSTGAFERRYSLVFFY